LERFNASIAADRFLAAAEIDASVAYADALQRSGVLGKTEAKEIGQGLRRVGRLLDAEIDLSAYEDIHSAVELLLTEEIGEAGKKLHTGRSRNEQVVTVERLYLKRRLEEGLGAVRKIQYAILGLAESEPDLVMPGYTHLQPAQCLLFSHYTLALYWQMERGAERLRETLHRVAVLPLGSGALAGSSVPLDRSLLAKQLGFFRISENSLDAVADRSYILETLFAFSLLLLDLSRFAEDLVIFSSREFGFFKLDDCIATSSSLMPQKKNPDFFELIRSKAGSVYGRLTELFIAIKGVPMSYCKDLQSDKEPLRRGVEEALDALHVFSVVLSYIEPDGEMMKKRLTPDMLATDLVDYLLEKGIPFREAHGIVGSVAAFSQQAGKPLDELTVPEFQQFSGAFAADVAEVFDFGRSLRLRRTAGSTHPDEVQAQFRRARDRLAAQA